MLISYSFIVIRGEPCKVVNISVHQDGKHGHAKATFTAISIFTGKKLEDSVQTSHNTSVPFIERNDFVLVDIDEADGFLTLMSEEGELREDLSLPHLSNLNTNANMSEMEELSTNITKAFQDGSEVTVTVLSSMGKEKVIAMHED